MDGVLYVVVWAAVMMLIMRYGCDMSHRPQEESQALGSSRLGGGALRWIAPATDVDPVCGKTVHTEKAKPSVHAGMVYYFCSRDCREVFEAAPDTYLGRAASQAIPETEHAHG